MGLAEDLLNKAGDDTATVNAPDDAALKAIAETAKRQIEKEKEVDEKEQSLKAAKVELKEISERLLPSLMAAARLKSFTLDDGSSVKCGEALYVSETGTRGEAVIKWLLETGNAALIQDRVVIAFGKGDDDVRSAFLEFLGTFNAGRPYFLDVDTKRSFNVGSVKALINEYLRDGKSVPMEELGIYQLNFSKITEAKR